MRPIAWHYDQDAIKAELERIRPRLEPLGHDMDVQYKELTKDCHVEPKAGKGPSRFTFRFLASPKAIIRDEAGRVVGMECEENTLVERKGSLSAKGLGETTVLPVDTVVFAIGDVVDLDLGLAAIKGGWGYTTNPNPDPQDSDAAAYQAYDPEAEQLIDGVFVIGWSRNASDGVVGVAKVDGEKGAGVVGRSTSGLGPFSTVFVRSRSRWSIRDSGGSWSGSSGRRPRSRASRSSSSVPTQRCFKTSGRE